jgi:hypothetical protein
MKEYFPYIFPFVFIAWGAFVLYILSLLSGWHRLAQRYPARGEPVGKTFNLQSARVGWVNYNNALTFIVAPEGIFVSSWGPFRFAHPALTIPWRDIYNVTLKKTLWREMARFEVSVPPFATFHVSRKVIEEARQYLEPNGVRF